MKSLLHWFICQLNQCNNTAIFKITLGITFKFKIKNRKSGHTTVIQNAVCQQIHKDETLILRRSSLMNIGCLLKAL